ncbi:MAG: hypothetical protein P4L76_17690 [Beijerinckiaceae bacterium]|nr:hypothetical protein [Beijerinckiaceae bacterium]
MADISALYPQPPQPNGANPLSNPSSALSLLSQVQQLKRMQSEQAVGGALQGAIGPDGTFDPAKALSGIAANPNAAYAAGEGITSALDSRNRQIAGDTAAFDLARGQNDYVQNIAGSLANAANPNEAIKILTDASRRTNLPTPMLTSMIASMPQDQKGFRRWSGQYASVAQGAAAANTRTPIVNPDGSTSLVPQSTLNTAPSGAGGEAGPSGGLGPMTKASQDAYLSAQGNAATIGASIRPLQNALPLIEKLSASDFGPGSAEYAKVKSILTTAGIIPEGATSVDMRQEVNKYLNQTVQAAQGAGRSDEALSAAQHANPHLDLTQPANIALVKNQIGMSRMDAAVTPAYDAASPGDKSKAGFKQFQSTYYQNTDPRAFRFDMMTPQERRDTLDGLGKPGSPGYQKFINSLRMARSSGAIMPDGGASGP